MLGMFTPSSASHNPGCPEKLNSMEPIKLGFVAARGKIRPYKILLSRRNLNSLKNKNVFSKFSCEGRVLTGGRKRDASQKSRKERRGSEPTNK